MGLFGCFNEIEKWKSVPMQKLNDVWTVTFYAPPGKHDFNFVVDGTDFYFDVERPSVGNPHRRRNNCINVEDGEELIVFGPAERETAGVKTWR